MAYLTPILQLWIITWNLLIFMATSGPLVSGTKFCLHLVAFELCRELYATNIDRPLAAGKRSMHKITLLHKLVLEPLHGVWLFLWINAVFCNTMKVLFIDRAAPGGYAAKAWSLAGFWKIENGGSSGSTPVKWPPLWRPCLPKIYRGGPALVKWSTLLPLVNSPSWTN